MSAYGQSPCEWCRVMIEDQEIHKCQRSDLREHIGDLRQRHVDAVADALAALAVVQDRLIRMGASTAATGSHARVAITMLCEGIQAIERARP